MDNGIGRRQWRMDLLRDMAQIGLRLIRVLDREITRHPDDSPRYALPYSVISRSIRQTLMLEAAFVADELPAQAKRASTPPPVPPRRPVSAAELAVEQKDRVRFLVERAIRSVRDRRRVEALELQLDERLDDPDFDAGLGQQPVGLAVAGLCRELGIFVDLSGFTAAELGMDEAQPQPAEKGLQS